MDEKDALLSIQDDDVEVLRQPGAGMASTVFNLTCSALGTGTLALPFAFALTGLGFGLLLLVALCLASLTTAWLLIRTGEETSGDPGFKNIARLALGRWGEWLMESLIVIFIFLSLVGYNVIMRDALPDLVSWMAGLESDTCVLRWWCNPHFLVAMWTIFIFFPLCVLKRIRFLAFTSGLSLASIVYLVSLLIFVEVSPHAAPVPPLSMWPVGVEALKAVPLLSSALVYHVNIGPVVREMHQPTTFRQRVATAAASLISLVVYAAAGSCGGLRFGQSVCSDALGQVTAVTGVAGRVAQIAFVLVVTASFPLQHWAGRVNLGALLFRQMDPTSHPRYPVFFVVCALSYLLLAYGLASVPHLNLGMVIGIAGATGGQLFLFILPGVFFLRIRSKSNAPWDAWAMLSVVAIIVGSCLVVVSLYATIGIHPPPCKSS